MKMPFTRAAFVEVFARYNLTVFPMQVALYLLAVIAIVFAARKHQHSGRVVSGVLSFFWLWMGIVYHIGFFTTINKAAYLFAAAFILQGLLLGYFGVIKNRLRFGWERDGYHVAGALFILFALIIYPLIGYLKGRLYFESPTFGLPCPTTIFTFGMLLFADNKFPIGVVVIPLLWSVLGFSAAFSLGITEDVGLLVAGLVGSVLIMLQRRHLGVFVPHYSK